MWIECQASRELHCAPERAFAKCLDSSRFPGWFRGYGPIAAIDRIETDGPPRVGGQRIVHNADGSVLVERITELTPPLRHAYTLEGMRPPFSWLVRRGDARWSIAPELAGSRVCWNYRFTLTTPLVWPLAKPLLAWFMTAAMARCLHNMARSPARISHPAPAASADTLGLTRPAPSAGLNVGPATSSPAFSPPSAPCRRLGALATERGEKCGQTPEPH